jgi:predicted DNA-binding transcriptional regulator AlpA
VKKKLVDPNELIDATEVAELLGLSHRTSVSVYQARYPDMPRPVVERGPRRLKLWVRSDIVAWATGVGRRTRG